MSSNMAYGFAFLSIYTYTYHSFPSQNVLAVNSASVKQELQETRHNIQEMRQLLSPEQG